MSDEPRTSREPTATGQDEEDEDYKRMQAALALVDMKEMGFIETTERNILETRKRQREHDKEQKQREKNREQEDGEDEDEEEEDKKPDWTKLNALQVIKFNTKWDWVKTRDGGWKQPLDAQDYEDIAQYIGIDCDLATLMINSRIKELQVKENTANSQIAELRKPHIMLTDAQKHKIEEEIRRRMKNPKIKGFARHHWTPEWHATGLNFKKVREKINLERRRYIKRKQVHDETGEWPEYTIKYKRPHGHPIDASINRSTISTSSTPANSASYSQPSSASSSMTSSATNVSRTLSGRLTNSNTQINPIITHTPASSTLPSTHCAQTAHGNVQIPSKSSSRTSSTAGTSSGTNLAGSSTRLVSVVSNPRIYQIPSNPNAPIKPHGNVQIPSKSSSRTSYKSGTSSGTNLAGSSRKSMSFVSNPNIYHIPSDPNAQIKPYLQIVPNVQTNCHLQSNLNPYNAHNTDLANQRSSTQTALKHPNVLAHLRESSRSQQTPPPNPLDLPGHPSAATHTTGNSDIPVSQVNPATIPVSVSSTRPSAQYIQAAQGNVQIPYKPHSGTPSTLLSSETSGEANLDGNSTLLTIVNNAHPITNDRNTQTNPNLQRNPDLQIVLINSNPQTNPNVHMNPHLQRNPNTHQSQLPDSVHPSSTQPAQHIHQTTDVRMRLRQSIQNRLQTPPPTGQTPPSQRHIVPRHPGQPNVQRHSTPDYYTPYNTPIAVPGEQFSIQQVGSVLVNRSEPTIHYQCPTCAVRFVNRRTCQNHINQTHLPARRDVGQLHGRILPPGGTLPSSSTSLTTAAPTRQGPSTVTISGSSREPSPRASSSRIATATATRTTATATKRSATSITPSPSASSSVPRVTTSTTSGVDDDDVDLMDPDLVRELGKPPTSNIPEDDYDYTKPHKKSRRS